MCPPENLSSATTQLANSRDRHLFGPGPKRILSLDGGGVRGAITVSFLEKLEKVIEEIEGKPTLLCDWFDLIGGTSAGSIIATALALGLKASEIRAIQTALAPS
ncbi:MAG TPA: patatin-like phospholipase family protein, partial [Bradyrhizobium sp.]